MQEGPRFDIRDAIIPEQKGVSGDHGLMVSVAGGELHRINLLLFEKGWRLLAQIHSHPTHAYHSEMDDEYAIATALGAFSLVVPHFA
ncbi:MAG TPA: Mov34/MPN/PAD-1 family protein, partial [Thermomicrobiales bacterium]|nr:Mov34/MPN/PAD-1 family protein [Thermomicrobiales bacterium]